MKKSNFWTLTLCALLIIASATGWSVPLRVAIGANAAVVLIEVAREAFALYKVNKGQGEKHGNQRH